MSDLYSYLKDSDSLIRLLRNLEQRDSINFLTMDVTLLYSNIDHEIGISCTEKYLLEDVEIHEIQEKNPY